MSDNKNNDLNSENINVFTEDEKNENHIGSTGENKPSTESSSEPGQTTSADDTTVADLAEDTEITDSGEKTADYPIDDLDDKSSPANGNSKQKLLASVCVLLTFVIFACLGFTAYSYYSAKSSRDNDQTEVVTEETTEATKTDPILSLRPNQEKTAFPKGMLEKYKDIYSFNPDIVGWLKLPNTSIDTVVTQDDDNKYYLKTDFYGNFTRYGNAFLDCRNNAKDLNQNNIIYGHTTEYPRQQVFSDLSKYKNSKFFIDNPIIEYGTLYADYEWKVCSVFISSVSPADDNGYFFYFIKTDFKDSDFIGFYSQMKQYSLYDTGVDVKITDKLLSLSTCTYENDLPGRTVNSRLVVVARLLRTGESKEIDITKVADHSDFRRPQVWYNYMGLKNPYANFNNWES